MTNSLLATVLPEAGPYLLATPASFVKDGAPVHYFKHAAFDNVADLERAAQVKDAEGVNAYFALGSILEVKKKEVRKKPNIARLRAFWVDIDIRPGKANHYQDAATAAQKLKDFCTFNSLPRPFVVDSGGGFHVYWPMTESIDKPRWEAAATILKAATEKFGLLADPMRTADCASVLRVPGTSNYKGETPRPVKVALSGAVTTPDQLIYAIEHSDHNAVKAQAQPSELSLDVGARPDGVTGDDVNKDAAGGVEMTEASAKNVVRKCRQLTWQMNNASVVEEPQWYDMIGCIRHADKGVQAVHRLSALYPGYKQYETDAKIQQHMDGGFGPTTCQTFEQHRPGGCEGCPYKGKVTTPLQLGREMKAQSAPVAEVKTPQEVVATKVTLPDPPFPFKRVMDTKRNEVAIAYSVFDKDEYEDEVVVYEHDIFPQRIIYDERDTCYVVEIRRFLPHDGWETFPVPLGKFYDKRNLSVTLGNIGVMPDVGKIETLVQYMVGYIRELQKHMAAATVYAQLGWRDDSKFILGDRVLENGAVTPLNPHQNIVNALKWQEPRGELTEWRKVMAMYEQPGLESFQFGIGVAWAAPLFKFTNYNGMIVSMVGEAGCGKSSVMHVVNSVWNHKEHNWIDMEHDTVLSFYNKLGVLNNLPVCYDEITNLDEDTVSDLCYAVSKGQGRQRLKQDGSARENHGSWKTMMLTTSNASLHSRLAAAKGDASAEAMRVFEYYVPKNQLPKAAAETTLDLLNENYGLAGEVYMHAVMKDLDKVKDRIKYWTRYMESAAKVSSGERFWGAGPACVLAGYEVANQAGLSNVDVERLAQFAVRTITNMRSVVAENTKTPQSALADYINGNMRHMMVLNQEPVDGQLAMISHEPRDAVRIRYELYSGKAFIDRQAFREWCHRRSIDYNTLMGTLKKQRILVDQKRMVLGKGTSFRTAQTWTLVIDMSHKEMAGVHQATALNATEIAGNAIEKARG